MVDVGAGRNWSRLTGAGRMFCAAVGLKERDRPASWLSDARAALDALEALEIPVIAPPTARAQAARAAMERSPIYSRLLG